MKKVVKQKCVIYIGDFDLRNENVQAHLVKNNAKILNRLGYKVAFVGVNRVSSFSEIKKLPELNVGDGNHYLELENTLSLKGLWLFRSCKQRILSFMNEVAGGSEVSLVISYQSPSYALVLKNIALWCRDNQAKYIVNSADIPVLASQPFLRRILMILNWNCLHQINRKYSDGLIAVSRYIERFYQKKGMPSVIIPPLFDDFTDSDFELSDFVTFVYAGTPFVLKKNVRAVGMKDRLDKIVDLCLRLSAEGVKYRLKIIGITKDLYIMCIPRHKDALEKDHNILFMGRYSHKNTLDTVRNADYMLNYRDINVMNEAGLSTKLVESVSLGTPVVMNSVGDSFKYLRDGVTGYQLSGDLTHDVSLLKSLCDKTKEERTSSKKKCASDKTFAIENYEVRMDDFIRSVLGK